MTENTSSILQQVQNNLLRPVHPRGVLWIGSAVLLTLISAMAGWDITPLCLVASLVLYICFRDPQRVPSQAEGLVVAPADGILTAAERAPWPAEAEMDGEAARITINPRFYDAHILRAPIASAITKTEHHAGQWGSNVFDKNSLGNERAVIMFKLKDERTAALEIIGGAMADRIRLSSRAGDVVTLGQALAYSAFGGEVRLYLPLELEVIAMPGQHMIAGETALAALASSGQAFGGASNDDLDDELEMMSSNDMGILPNSAGFKF